ncbi:MAG TPA: helix-turn-helix transcriptional regulator [Chloroflexi bacterium]|jgi:MerR family transcriptional regulator/heat shock protein HspR|nr:helix-turn-helix transcriptional regulator [Chloroflexota bacterium]
MTDERLPDDEPCYVISIAARMVQLHPQTLRYYDRIGLIKPSRTSGRIRLYSQRDIDVLRKIARLTEDLGVNLAGVEVILNMSDRIEKLQAELEEVQRQAEAEVKALRQRVKDLEGRETQKTYQIIDVSAREVKGVSQEDMP